MLLVLAEVQPSRQLHGRNDAFGFACSVSTEEQATFRFSGSGIAIKADVTRADFEDWIAGDVARMAAAVDEALSDTGVGEAEIDRFLMTGGTSMVPAVRGLFSSRIGADQIMSGGELTSIAHGLALIAQEEDVAAWTA